MSFLDEVEGPPDRCAEHCWAEQLEFAIVKAMEALGMIEEHECEHCKPPSPPSSKESN